MRRPQLIALVAVAALFVVGVVVVVATGASAAHLGTLLVACVSLGTILATALDRTRGPQAAKR